MAALALEPLYLPCSAMNCGDAVYRASLDPTLRLEEEGITLLGLFIVVNALGYLLVKPGILRGFFDYYFLNFVDRALFRRPLSEEDFKLGRVLGKGGFGDVYEAELRAEAQGGGGGAGASEQTVVKVAKEYGMAEVWMNERLQRNCPKFVAQFISAFEVARPKQGRAQRLSGRARRDPEGEGDPRKRTLWLVWKYEGKETLDSSIMKKDFPYCMEELLFKRSLAGEEGDAVWRKARSVRAIMQQILEGLKAMHAVGIVHRDVKPQNLILAEADNRLKFIDFGAAADLLVGINYTPDDYLLDPRYAAPERYIMSTSTPRPPTAPFAALLSPILWLLNQPDRFDMYSVGLIFMQLVFEPLRRDAGLATFNKALQKSNYSVQAWRKTVARDAKYAEGVAIMDLDNGAGWDLADKLLNVEPGSRLTAAAALAHPFTNRIPVVSAVSMAFNSMIGGTAFLPKSVRKGTQYIGDKIVKSGTASGGGLTEVDLRQIRREVQGKGGDREILAEDSLEDVSETVSQWKRRKSILKTRQALGTQFVRATGEDPSRAKKPTPPPSPRVPPAPWWKRQSSGSNP